VLTSVCSLVYHKEGTMMQMTLGIDVAKDTLAVALRRSDVTLHSQFTNDTAGHQRLLRWLQKHSLAQRPHACLEATGRYGEAIATLLYQEGYPVSVVNPARIKAYAHSRLQRNKTDKADALLIATFCATEQPQLWSPPPASFRDLQLLVRRFEDLQDNLYQERNRVQAGPTTPFVLADVQGHLQELEMRLAALRKEIHAHLLRYPELHAQQQLLESIPGIAELTAAKLLGEIRAITDFESARQLAAYAGLHPANFLSGTSVHRKARLAKTGNAHLRRILYMPALSAKRWNPIVKAFCERLAENGLCPMQIVAAAMHKLLHLVYGVLKTGRPFDPDYLVKQPSLV
jgi:transposase